MNGYSALLRTARWSVLPCLAALHFSAEAASKYQTNWVERTITNQIEIRMPRNVFVNEYKTNWFDVFKTNLVQAPKTNQVTRWQTNHPVVTLTRTNYVDVSRTNWLTRKELREVVIERSRTNYLDAYHTNWTTRLQTNEVAVTLTRTNYVDQFRTNWQTIHLTNWQTVLAIRTNWIVQHVTNVAEINLPLEPTSRLQNNPRAGSVTSKIEPPAAPAPDDPIIEGSRTTRSVARNLGEVELRIRWPKDIADPLPVRHWKIESENGAFLCFGQEQQFIRELPLGTYRVEANLYREVDNAALVVYGRLTVNTQQASVQPRASGKRLAAATY
jgi:hypothetical protein